MKTNREKIREQILAALAHPEAEDGLYLENLSILHEEDERPAVEGDENEILRALEDLIAEGGVKKYEESGQFIYSLAVH